MPTDTAAGRTDDASGEQPPAGAFDDLTFTTHDLGRDCAPSPPPDPALGFEVASRPPEAPPLEHVALAASLGEQPFRIGSSPVPAASDSDPPWTVREPVRSPAAARRGWSTRPSHLGDRSAHAAMLRLREEAVHVSWKAAWIAVTAANPRLSRQRDL